MSSTPQDASHQPTPTVPPVNAMSPTLARNIEAVLQRRREVAAAASLEERIAAAISKFAGSMVFVYIHLVLFGSWILINVGLIPFIPAWDPSLVVLAMVASVEAIFLSTFVLINQNRMAAEDSSRSDLDLQISLLNEHETTRLITLVDAIAQHLGVQALAKHELRELERDVAPVEVLERIEEEERK